MSKKQYKREKERKKNIKEYIITYHTPSIKILPNIFPVD